jgi:branched-chain amino acid transport system permease protein
LLPNGDASRVAAYRQDQQGNGRMSVFLIHVLNALLYSSALFLIAGGLSLIYGVMRILNLAHGNLYGLGAFVTAWAIGRALEAGAPVAVLFLLLPAGAIAAAACGALIERTLLRPFYKRPEEYQLLMTFGLLMILEDLIRLIWGPDPLSATTVYAALGSISIGEDRYPAYNLVIIAVGIFAAVFLWAFIYRTRFGVILRATSQDKRMASALGVNVNRVYIQAFTLGCFMAGLGGAIVVPSQSAVLGMGVDALVLAFIVVVIGGLGSLEGALAGALIVGVVREAGITLFPEIELAVLYLIAALVLLARPAGLFGRA